MTSRNVIRHFRESGDPKSHKTHSLSITPPRLLQHFDEISEAPDAVSRLRRFILDLAVRGKLVEQDPNDEPASELLKRIEVEKARLASAGEIRKSKSIEPVDVFPFEISQLWKWVAVRTITSDRGQKVPETKFSYIDVSAIDNRRGVITEPQVVMPDVAPSRARKLVRKGDVIYSCVRPYLLNIAIIEEDFSPEPIVSTAFAVLNGLGLVLPRYLWLVLRSPFFVSAVEEKMRGQAYPAINDSDFARLPLPLPPFPEQHRIVARVDELMKLCDELEAAQGKRETRRNRLVAATLHGLNNGHSEESEQILPFEQSARFYFNHLPRLTTRPQHIKQLRQTILNLAIRGKLVPQDPNDEAVTDLLASIASERERLAKQGKCTDRAISVIDVDIPFEVPASWAWVRLGSITICRDGERIPVSKEERSRRSKVYDYYGASGVIDKIDGYLFDKPLLLIGEDGANLLNRSTPIAYIARGKYWVNNHAHVLDGISEPFLRFLEMHINAIDLTPLVTGTAQPKMNQAKMNSIPIALPPRGEQHRIAAKVDELMTLCDEIETWLTTTTGSRRQLLEGTLHEILDGRTGCIGELNTV